VFVIYYKWFQLPFLSFSKRKLSIKYKKRFGSTCSVRTIKKSSLLKFSTKQQFKKSGYLQRLKQRYYTIKVYKLSVQLYNRLLTAIGLLSNMSVLKMQNIYNMVVSQRKSLVNPMFFLSSTPQVNL